MRLWLPILLLVCVLPIGAGCGDGDPVEDLARKAERQREAALLVDRLDDPAILERVVALGEVEPVLQATGEGFPDPVRRAACTALGRLGGEAATARLRALARAEGAENRWVRRYAAAALAGEPPPAAEVETERQAEELLSKPLDEYALSRVVELGAVEPVRRATEAGPNRALACLALGAIGGPAARARLEEIVAAPGTSHELRLHARRGLELLDVPRALVTVRDEIADRLAVEREGMEYAAILANPDAVDQVVELGAVWVLLDATAPDKPQRMRHQAAVGLGRVGGPEARDRLIELLQSHEGDVDVDGPMRLYAAVGLTLLQDPGTAIDLLLMLSRINPNDNIAVRAEEGQSGAYYTIDAQICDALLGLGLWDAEEELIEQMRRRHYIRVLIDAHAVLRRRTGLALPFRYNGSYADRDADVAAWEKALRETRAERYRKHPFAANDPDHRKRLIDMLAWLEGKSVNNRYIARKVVQRLGPYAVPSLVALLRDGTPVGQREAARLLGLIGDRAAVDDLDSALRTLKDAHARGNAIKALRLLGGGRDRPDLRERGWDTRSEVRHLLADGDAAVRAEAARYLGAFGDDEDLVPLRVAAKAEIAPATRTAMLCALLRRGDESVVPALEKVAAEGSQQEQEAAKAALAGEAGK
jgi:HEAT repeat protein